MEENNEDKKDKKDKKLGDIFRKGVQGLRDRLNFDSSDLIRAVDKGDVEMVDRILYAGFDPNKEDGIRRLALPIAVDNNNVEIVELLLKARANPNKADKNGDLPLRKAVYWESMAMVQMLLNAGADIHKENRAGVSAMDEARKNNYASLIDLMENFKDPERVKQIEEDTKRHEALKKKAAAAKEERIENEKQATEEAIHKKEADDLKELIRMEKFYKVEELGYVAGIVKAIQEKDSKAVKLFVKKTEELNVIDEASGKTPLFFAVEQQHVKLASFLMKEGADPFYALPTVGQSPFSKAVGIDFSDFVEAVLRNAGEEVSSILNAPTQLLSPQFMSYKSPRMFDLLLGAGADPLFGGTEGVPPILKAVEKGSVAILPVLTRHGFDLNQNVNGDTLLEWAIEYKRMDWLNGLLEEGANIDELDEDGRTPLMMAVETGQEDAVRLLLEKDANTKLTNADGKTALEIAQGMEGREAIVEMLS